MKDHESHLICYVPFPEENVITSNKNENKSNWKRECGYV